MVESLKQAPFLQNATFEQIDFSTTKAKELLKKNNISLLPAVLLNTNEVSDEEFITYLTETPNKWYTLNIGAQFDPYAEICDNKTDDNEDGKIDCEDTTCLKNLSCAPKVDKPVADLYIMSYCPYGLQAQKWYLEVMSKLWKVADINVKFVPYIMHGKKEAVENVVQYCIQKEEPEKYVSYLKCFLQEEWKETVCIKEASIDEEKLKTCIAKTNETYKIEEKVADSSKQFPDFDIDATEAQQVWVEWSPTFVLNGIKIENIWRDAQSYAKAICSSFKNTPQECEETFQNITFDPMFGFTSNGANANSACWE